MLFSRESGELMALMNASEITAIRTAAVSAVATRALAREDAHQLGIIGAGVQARTHLAALAAVRSITWLEWLAGISNTLRNLSRDATRLFVSY